MKTLLTTILCSLCTYVSFCQEITLPMQNGYIEYKEVQAISGKSQKDLYLNAKKFFANYFKSAQNVIELDDLESGNIIGKGNFSVFPKYMGMPQEERVNFTLKLECKDGRYRYTFTAFNNPLHKLDELNDYISGKKSNWNTPKKYARQIASLIDEKIKSAIADLNEQMAKIEDDF